MADSTALDVVSKYTAALAAADTEEMNSLRVEGFILDFVHRDAADLREASAEDIQAFWPAWFGGFDEFDYEVTRTIVAEDLMSMSSDYVRS